MGNPASWSQATWFIDPQNVSGTASDANTGIDATHAVLTYNGGVAAKWGTFSPILAQDTTLTWLSSQPANDDDPVVLTPYCLGIEVTITAALPAAVHSGTLASVVAKNRSTPQLLQADLGYAASGGMLVQNTTHSSFAWVYANVSGTKFTLSQPLPPQTLPVSGFGSVFGGLLVEVDTWANGDSFSIYEPISVNLVVLKPQLLEYDLNNEPSAVQVQHIRLSCGNGVGACNVWINNQVTFVECSFDSYVTMYTGGDDQFFLNTYIPTGIFDMSGSNVFVGFLGGIIQMSSVQDTSVSGFLDYDVIVDASAGGVFSIGSVVYPGLSAAVGSAYVKGVMSASGLLNFNWSAYSGTNELWGPGTLDAQGHSRIVYSATKTAAATFKNTGGLKLNGQTTCSAYSGTAWKTLSLTPAHLDAAYGASGFGGTATNVGGASITGQGTL